MDQLTGREKFLIWKFRNGHDLNEREKSIVADAVVQIYMSKMHPEHFLLLPEQLVKKFVLQMLENHDAFDPFDSPDCEAEIAANGYFKEMDDEAAELDKKLNEEIDEYGNKYGN